MFEHNNAINVLKKMKILKHLKLFLKKFTGKKFQNLQ